VCRLCQLYEADPRYRELWSDDPGAFCVHLGGPSGQTRPCDVCGKGKVEVPLLECAKHGLCTRQQGVSIAGVQRCGACPDRERGASKQQQPPDGSCYPPIKTRDLLYHVYPLEMMMTQQQQQRHLPAVWRRRLAAVLSRIDLFNGARVIAVATGPGTAHTQDVRKMAEPFGCEVIHVPNDPDLREAKTLPVLLARAYSLEPDRALFFAHAKGVTRPYDAGNTCHAWAELLEETLLDYWPVVAGVLARYPLAGSCKKVGPGCFDGSASAWHYSGSFFWCRSRELFSRPDWKARIDRHWWGVETYPSLHFPAAASAGCVFHEAPASVLNLYDPAYVQNTVLPELVKFRQKHAAVARAKVW
jgi:hypothetical protein